MERKKKENSLHEGKTQINSVWIQIGMKTTAIDMSKWNVKKSVQLAENLKGGGTHANMTSNDKQI